MNEPRERFASQVRPGDFLCGVLWRELDLYPDRPHWAREDVMVEKVTDRFWYERGLVHFTIRWGQQRRTVRRHLGDTVLVHRGRRW